MQIHLFALDFLNIDQNFLCVIEYYVIFPVLLFGKKIKFWTGYMLIGL